MASLGPDSPRQKMINLMYIVLLAMLALNVSSDVLKGFTVIEQGLDRSAKNATSQNQTLYKDIEDYLKKNPEKVKEWFVKAQTVRLRSDALSNYVNVLKWKIVREADGDKANINDIHDKEGTEPASFVMLAPGTGQGRHLTKAIDSYRALILSMVTDPTQRKVIESNLGTSVPRNSDTVGKNWAEYMFENMPVSASVTLLTKLQNDIRYAEGEVLHTLVANIDVHDIKVNEVSAFVIPNSQTIVRGGKFSARIVMAALDTTQRPSIYIGNRLYGGRNGLYETICNRTGDFTLQGFLEMNSAQGVIRRPFMQKYSVIDPAATVSATMMNVLYAGYDNPMSVSVPGVPNSQVKLSVSNGSLHTVIGGYICRPLHVGETTFTVTANIQGRTQVMGEYKYQVRQLPDPQPFLGYTEGGVHKRYRGGGRGFSKGLLMETNGIEAAIDDGLLNVNFKVLSFETVFFDNMGNAVPELSAGSQFSARQREDFRRLSRGKRFYISRVKAVGPDGVTRQLDNTLEVIVN